MQGKVESVVLLKQIPGELQKIKKGELFRVRMRDAEDNLEWSGWQVALADANVKPNGKTEVNSDQMHLIMGRPELVNIISKSDGDTSMNKASDIGSSTGAQSIGGEPK